MSALAALALAAAWWCWLSPQPRLVDRVGSGQATRRWLARLALGAAGLVALVCLGPSLGVWLVLVGVLGGTGHWLLRASTARRAEDRARAQVAEGCQVVAAQLQAGQVPVRALAQAAQDCPVFVAAAAAQHIGGDVPNALRAASRKAGAHGLAALASAWELSQTSGAPIAAAAGQVARELAEEERLREVVSAELAAPRASGKLLALLPLVGVAMAVMVGADPGQFLLGTLGGRLCVLVAAGLTCAGVVWTERLADRAGRLQGDIP